MIYIVEGPDGLCKTTFATALAKKRNIKYAHGSSFYAAKQPVNAIFGHYLSLVAIDNIVYDRFVYSNLIYGTVYEGYNHVNLGHVKLIEQAFYNIYGPIPLILMMASPEHIMKCVYERGDDQVKPDFHLDMVIKGYDILIEHILTSPCLEPYIFNIEKYASPEDLIKRAFQICL